MAYCQDVVSGGMRISKEAMDLIVEFETGGQSYYNARLKRPTVPPGFSGITWAAGYDAGYNTAAQIRADWKGVIPDAHVERLASVAGLKQAKAKAALARVKDIAIPWDAAMTVYKKKTLPRFAKLTEQTYPGLTKMHPHIQGVMVSTTFNRGSSLSGDRRRELLWSRNDIRAGINKKLPAYQTQMRRLWLSIKGLQRRYTAHAGLMQRALDDP